MNGDVIAVIAGCASAALFLTAKIRIRSIRKSGRDELIRIYKEKGR